MATLIARLVSPSEPVEIVIRPEDLTEADAGQTLTFTCVAYGVPLPTISWSQGGVIITNDTDTRVTIYNEEIEERGLVFYQSILEICSAELTDSGVYSCSADNGISNDSVSFEIRVEGKSVLDNVVVM